MDSNYPQQNNFVNPADLFSSVDVFGDYTQTDLDTKTEIDFFDTTLSASDPNGWASPNDLTRSHQDSGVDLRGVYATGAGFPSLKTEDSGEFETFLTTPYSTPASNTSNTPSQHGDMIFSNANSPGDYTRDQSQTSSPEADTKYNHDYRSANEDSILIPQTVDPPKVEIYFDKTKTRAETQIKTFLVINPLSRQYQWIRFPRHTLSKSKQLASHDEIAANEEQNSAVRVKLMLVCATAVEKPQDLARALRRARGEEETPKRARGTQVSEIEKDDPAHPQNGGAVVICEGCKERERKRYDRKKKRNQDEENEWTNYEDDRIIMINEKEFKRLQDVEPDANTGTEAKKVEFAMRITCYCRHQEEKSPMGYKVIFTLRDTNDVLLAQQVSEVIQITDDHKNREMPVVESIRTDLNIQTPGRQEPVSAQYSLSMYNYSAGPVYGMYSQPTTPVMPQFQSPMSSTDGFYPQSANAGVPSQATHQSAFTFNAGNIAAPSPAPSFANHQRYQSYSNTPMLSPTEQFQTQTGYPMVRPHSMDNFSAAFANMGYPAPQNTYNHAFASQPPSRNVSRPASPSWDQGPSRAKKMRAVPGFFMVEDPDNE
ncbi:hypothetical protein EK21DRAFT_108917 [Setomelanomma holmii]|uniref:SPT23/MGA2-like DNA-binding domain-containing protein n=1 Tax=Setomelanomma holmii TaxID=210430 RepID=A0A9P4HG70_9PLEO|nr:hypothetical protein EK21DRAFT_108917 [Setomelanomma holmii]